MEVTEEMKEAAWNALPMDARMFGVDLDDMGEVIAAVLKIVEREHATERAAEYYRGYSDARAERSYNP